MSIIQFLRDNDLPFGLVRTLPQPPAWGDAYTDDPVELCKRAYVFGDAEVEDFEQMVDEVLRRPPRPSDPDTYMQFGMECKKAWR